MPRDLLPLTVYLTPEAKQEAVRRASELMVPTAALLRLILHGKQEPLGRG